MLMLNIFNFCEYWWLAWLLPFLLGLALGWAIWSKWKKMFHDMEATAADLRKEIARLEEELLNCGKENSRLKGDLALCEGRYKELEASFDELKALSADSEVGDVDLNLGISDADADLDTNIDAGIVSGLDANADSASDIEGGDDSGGDDSGGDDSGIDDSGGDDSGG
ncbi:MAG: hypothetical protein HKO66_12770, partial [Saprospiraceae bacterium]|nr:hypothetical protein [Saprospiraceae bacterium]